MLTARKGSSITRWLNGTYTGDNEAVAAGVERWLDTRADHRDRQRELALQEPLLTRRLSDPRGPLQASFQNACR